MDLSAEFGGWLVKSQDNSIVPPSSNRANKSLLFLFDYV